MRYLLLFLLAFFLLQPPLRAESEACQTAAKYGSIEVLPESSPYILAAPHGIFDKHTGLLASQLCQALKWNCLIARGQRTEKQPINVNRPTEGVHLPSEQESHTPRAKEVFECYQSHLLALKRDRFKLYIELHGNARAESQGQIEIATVGLTPTQAQTIKVIFMAALKQTGLSPRLKIAMQDLDPLHFNHSGAKKWGVFQKVQPVLALEIPAWARKEPMARAALLKTLTLTFAELENRQLP
ncbi:MAG: hypothetical protein IV090_12575 [Candidatus Sericytochromatia bacterium]|nr:hypothetical protein [Candidatus Sericytochromatia bacterium]